MRKILKKFWKFIKKFPLSHYALLYFMINFSYALFGVKFWYDTAWGIARLLIFFPAIFVYSEIDEMFFYQVKGDSYRVETDLILIGLFFLLDLLLLSLRTGSLKNLIKKTYHKLTKPKK